MQCGGAGGVHALRKHRTVIVCDAVRATSTFIHPSRDIRTDQVGTDLNTIGRDAGLVGAGACFCTAWDHGEVLVTECINGDLARSITTGGLDLGNKLTHATTGRVLSYTLHPLCVHQLAAF